MFILSFITASAFAIVSGMNITAGNYGLSFVFIGAHIYFVIAGIGAIPQ